MLLKDASKGPWFKQHVVRFKFKVIFFSISAIIWQNLKAFQGPKTGAPRTQNYIKISLDLNKSDNATVERQISHRPAAASRDVRSRLDIQVARQPSKYSFIDT